MVCPLGTVVAGVNTRTGVTAAPDTWDPRVMDVKAVIAEEIIPDGKAVESVGSALVETFTSPATWATPMVKPASVTVTAVAAASVPPVTVTTTKLAPGGATVRVTPGADDCPVMAPEAKKPVG